MWFVWNDQLDLDPGYTKAETLEQFYFNKLLQDHCLNGIRERNSLIVK